MALVDIIKQAFEEAGQPLPPPPEPSGGLVDIIKGWEVPKMMPPPSLKELGPYVQELITQPEATQPFLMPAEGGGYTVNVPSPYQPLTPEERIPTEIEMGEFPLYTAYESPLLAQTGEEIMKMLRGEGVGIPEEALQWQKAMGRITEAGRGAQEAVTKLASRQGRMDSGLYATQQIQVVEEVLQQRVATAEAFAIRTSEMEQEAKRDAIGAAMGYVGFEAGEAFKVQQVAYQKWSAALGLKVRASDQAYDWKKTQALWEQQLEQIKAGAEAAAPGFWDYFTSIVGNFMGGLAEGLFPD